VNLNWSTTRVSRSWRIYNRDTCLRAVRRAWGLIAKIRVSWESISSSVPCGCNADMFGYGWLERNRITKCNHTNKAYQCLEDEYEARETKCSRSLTCARQSTWKFKDSREKLWSWVWHPIQKYCGSWSITSAKCHCTWWLTCTLSYLSCSSRWSSYTNYLIDILE